MLLSLPYVREGRAWGYPDARSAFLANIYAWDDLGVTVYDLVIQRHQGQLHSLLWVRYAMRKMELAWRAPDNRGRGNKALRRMAALYGVQLEHRRPALRLAERR